MYAAIRRRIFAPFTLAVLLLFTLVPMAFAASTMPSKHDGLNQHYLALGDSLAFGFQPNGDFSHGYVTDFFQQDLQEDGVRDVTNLACPGER